MSLKFNIFKRKDKTKSPISGTGSQHTLTNDDNSSNVVPQANTASNGSPRTPRGSSTRVITSSSPNSNSILGTESDEGSDTNTPTSPASSLKRNTGGSLSKSRSFGGSGALTKKTFKQGPLMKEGERIRSWKKRHFKLCSDGVEYYKLTRTGEVDKLAGVIPLGKSTTVEKCSDKTKKYGFQITTQKRIFYLQAANEQELSEWIQAIQNVVANELTTDVDSHESQESDKNRKSNADMDSSPSHDTDDPTEDNDNNSDANLSRTESKADLRFTEESDATHAAEATDRHKFVEPKSSGNAVLHLTEEEEYDIAMCSAEIFLKDPEDRTPEEQAYVLAMEQYVHALIDYGEKYHAKPEYSLASGTCIFSMPEEMRTQIEREYVSDITAEKATHLNIIDKKRDISMESQIEMQDAAAKIFAKPPSERTLEEREYVSKVRRTLRDISRIEREHGMKVQHSLMTSVLMHAKYEEERGLEDMEYLDLIQRKIVV
jgi:hypothetical protein